MASRPKGYGMTAELQAKKAAKYDIEAARLVKDWICAVTGESGAVTGESGAVTGESGAVTGESGAVTGESGAVTGESGAVTGESGPVDASSDEMWKWLKDGIILCKLINCIEPGSVKKINESKMAFKMMENIGNFLARCEKYGCPKTDMFQTVDLYEAQNMPQVINGIIALGRKAGSKGFKPSLGPKEATANKREFSEQQLQEGQNVIGLQMGSNKGASQAGSTPYGLGRQIEKTNLKV